MILADDATGNLDPENKQAIVDLLFEAVAQEALRFAVGEERGAILLGRRDLGLQYRFLERQGRALLAATPREGP